MAYQHYTNHHDAAKAIISLLIVLLAFGLFLIFYSNQDQIMQGDNFYMFMTLATVFAGLLVGLLYLVNRPHAVKKATVHKAKVSKTASKKKRSR